MNADEFEAGQRARERFHSLTVPPGAWTVLRLDGRGFSKFTEPRFDKPFDLRFSGLMADTALAVLTEFGGRYAYTQSDEISVLLDPGFALFGRGVEKLVSISASIAASTFTHRAAEPVQFDSRIWIGTEVGDVVDYFSWRQSDAARGALNGWCYWTLRRAGRSRQQATQALDRTSTAQKNDLLAEHGVSYAEVPAWQRGGVGLRWETYEKPAVDPLRKVEVVSTRRRVHIDRELPMREDYRAFVAQLAAIRT